MLLSYNRTDFLHIVIIKGIRHDPVAFAPVMVSGTLLASLA